MKKKNIEKLISGKTLILDGASGTRMQELGMPPGVCPEFFALDNPGLVARVQEEYYEAGSDIVYTFTFGASYPKLKHFGAEKESIVKTNREIARISCGLRDEMKRKYPERKFLVAGDMAPTGEFLKPAGVMDFEELKTIYRNQAQGLLEGGVDLFIIETMMDLDQARAAVLAVKEICRLPVFVTMTFEKGKTLSGNSPLECLIVLESLGVSAFGANCSSGPEEMLEVLRNIAGKSSVPLIAKPNAGMPEEKDGKTVFPMGPDEFGEYGKEFTEEGITILGGCCGTTPGHISKLSQICKNIKPNIKIPVSSVSDMICSSRESISINKNIRDIPYGEVCCKDPSDLSDEISERCDEGAKFVLIDFTEYENSGKYDEDEVAEGFMTIGMLNHVPLAVKSNNPSLVKKISVSYCGRIGIITDNREDEMAKAIDFYGLMEL